MKENKEDHKKIEIMDTTLRDGEQTEGVSFTESEKCTIAKSLLKDVNVDAIEITSARMTDDEFNTAKKIASWAQNNDCLEKLEVLGFADRGKSLEWIDKTGIKVMNLLAKGSLKHVELQLKKTKEEHVEDIISLMKEAKNKGISMNVYLEDWSNGMRDSKDYVIYLIDNLTRKGVNRVMLADTLGILDDTSTYRYVKELADKFPETTFDYHGHNDYDLSLANSIAAVRAGARRIHTTVNGLGERTGNTKLASVVVALKDLEGIQSGIKEKKLIKISNLVETFSGQAISANSPIVGRNVFIQNCGVHADGDKKGKLYHTSLTPERFGAMRRYSLGKTSGIASIEQNLKHMQMDDNLTKEQKKKILAKVKELSQKKESITSEDLPFIMDDVMGSPETKKIRIKDYEFRIMHGFYPEARVILDFKGKEKRGNATGDGQYDAFMNAIKRIYENEKKNIPELIDYAVRIPPGGKTNALVETTISWRYPDNVMKTKGVDSDQLVAAIEATIKMLNLNEEYMKKEIRTKND